MKRFIGTLKAKIKKYARYNKLVYSVQLPNKIKLIINDSPFANAHKCVDAVIRILRNAFDLSNERIADNKLMQQMVNWYNNTPHSALRLLNLYYQSFYEKVDEHLTMKEPKYIFLTPNQMQHDRDLEWQYIRAKKMELKEIQQKQRMKGLLTCKPGNIIILHTDYGKTEKKHEKCRRVFNYLVYYIIDPSPNVQN